MISIVIPTYGSAKNLKALTLRVARTMGITEWEIIFVDDCGNDNTLEVLREMAKKIPQIKVISFSRNFGQQLASSCGLRHTKGDAVIIMDDDLQDPPELIPDLIKKWQEGYDVVYAVRNRKENRVKKWLYKMFYELFNKISYQQIPIDSGDFGLMSRRVVDVINLMPEHSRLLRGMRSWVGFKQIGITYDRPKRKGKPAYTLKKVMQFVMYSLLAFSNMPLYISFVMGVAALCYGKFFDAMELFCIGILGKYIVRISDEVNQRPLYIIKEKINL